MVGAARLVHRLAYAVALAALTIPAGVARAQSVRVGSPPAHAAGWRALPSVAPSLRLHVTVTLRPRDPAALAAYADAVSQPGSPQFRRYLTPTQFARRFGATPATVSAVRAALRAHGLNPGTASAGALSIPVTASAAALEGAFSISLQRYALPGRRTAIAASAAPAFAAAVAGDVESVVGLDTSASPQPLLVRPRTDSPNALGATPATPHLLSTAHVVTGGPQPCAAALTAAPEQSAYTADQIASAYGFAGLYAAGDFGQGVTVAVYELEPDDANDIASYQSCYGTHAKISTVRVDGGAGSGPGSGEAALDIENLIGLAPDVRVIVYQGPNSNSGSPGAGPYDTFSAIINADAAKVVSVSWGECEAQLGHRDALAEDELFQQAAVQGQTVVAASGDSGAEDCDDGGPHPSLSAAVDDPSSQPYVTGVGGTSLQTLGPRPTETVWNTTLSPGSTMGAPGAGGGGVSNYWAMAPAQLDAAPALGVLNPAATGHVCGKPSGYCREVPDVSANADPTYGYLIYWDGQDSVVDEPSGWQGIGGTSAASPVWAALMALTDASAGCTAAPIGYADPALYRAAGQAYAADFNDVTTGNNDFTGTNGGNYAAGPGYDLATGLGTPNAAALAASLCADSITVTDPGPQSSAVGASVALRLSATDVPGSTLTYASAGLPAGLTLSRSTGVITGAPRRRGRFSVQVIVRDEENASATATFTWTVGSAPTIASVSLTADAAGSPLLALTVDAGHDSPAISSLTIMLPRSLRLSSGQGVSALAATGPGTALRFSMRLAGPRTAIISLGSPARSLRLRFRSPALSAVGGRLPDAALAGSDRLRLTVGIVDAGNATSRLSTTL